MDPPPRAFPPHPGGASVPATSSEQPSQVLPQYARGPRWGRTPRRGQRWALRFSNPQWDGTCLGEGQPDPLSLNLNGQRTCQLAFSLGFGRFARPTSSGEPSVVSGELSAALFLEEHGFSRLDVTRQRGDPFHVDSMGQSVG